MTYDGQGYHPNRVDPLPDELMDHLVLHTNNIEKIVTASVEGDRGLLIEALEADPLVKNMDAAKTFMQSDRPVLAPQQTVIGVVGRCGPRFEGRVVAIDPRVAPATRSVQLRARVPNRDGELYPGMAVRVRLIVGEIPGALVVPQEAVVRQGTKHMVYVVDGAGLAQPHEVELGQFFVDGVHVRSGIAPGARIVVAGQQKLRPGSPIREVPYQPTQNPNLDLGRFGPLADCQAES